MDWQDKLIDLIEEEIVLATGIKNKEHHSGDCRMNEILRFVEEEIRQAQEEMLERIKLEKMENKEYGDDDYEDGYEEGKEDGYNKAVDDLETLKKSIKKGA